MGEVLAVGAQRGGPQEHERVHGRLEQGLHGAQVEHALVILDGLERLHHARLHGLVLRAVALVLGPREEDDDEADGEEHGGGVEGGHRPEAHVGDEVVGQQAGDDGHEAVAEEDGLGERLVEPLGFVPALEVLRHEPGLKRREQQRGGDAAEEAPHHQHPVVGPVLGDAAQDVGDAVRQRGVLAPVLVSHGTHDGAEDHRRPEAGDEELADVAGGVPVVLVQSVHVGALKPVTGHHEAVHEQVPVAKGEEVLGHGDALLGAHLLHLQHRAAYRQASELNPVVALHLSASWTNEC
mmetsp:Transcript_26350/g.64720  ORF Transcript_26350/g.64720 Transcript_26350/m.64720 type:complete len:294 (+) Transcript_26350:791-1672(+)